MFALAAQPFLRATTSATAPKVSSKEQKSAALSSKAAGAAAALFLFASPALACVQCDGLTLQNGSNSGAELASNKYTQPFFDPRPVVVVDMLSSAEIGTEASRVAPNKQVGGLNCKTITGRPCEAASQINMQ
eukprot:CAMPEP_0181348374 /NCGR_PEP_ID=MMETSP1106-20121128/138_1 /TAXON_ID=81844 /ORGANISM="Mantoniella antarctica, Strain SL-175" /LENGTH=131 /DNA_ID=CAMNT_0023460655 /DNA_START=891 /DNA_END=1286 /DNA_ORIENTATION=-